MEVEVVENCLPVELVVERRYRIGPVCETQASPLLCVAEAIGVEAVGCETQAALGEVYPEEGESTGDLFEKCVWRVAQRWERRTPALDRKSVV